MVKFITRRLLLTLVTLLVVSVIIFIVTELTPGNIARNVLGNYVTPEQEQSYLAQLGLNRPLHIRYISWMLGSDWQAEQATGLHLVQITSDMGNVEWWAEEAGGVLVQWKLQDGNLMASRRYPDGRGERMPDNDRWQVDPSGNRYFWGVDNGNRAVKWEIGPKPLPSGGVDLRFSDETRLSDTALTDADGLSVQLNAGARAPGIIPADQWVKREVDLSSLAGRNLEEILVGADYRAAGIRFPVQIAMFVGEVELVQTTPTEQVLWRSDFTVPGSQYCGTFDGSATGQEGGATSAAIVDSQSEGVGEHGTLVFKVVGAISDQQQYVDYCLYRGLGIPVQNGMHLRYTIYYSSPASGLVVWEFGIGGWHVKRGGPIEYIPLQKGFLRGDPGISIQTRRPVMETLFRRLRNTLLLAAIAFLVIMPLALVLGVIAGLNEGKFIDRFLSLFGLATTSTPDFAWGVILIVVFTSWLKLLPGATVFSSDDAAFTNPQMLVLPVLTLTLVELGYVLRITRASMVDVMREPYIRVAALKGLPFRRIVLKHALRNAMIAPITVIMLHVNWLIGGVVVVEAIFGFPGLGRTLYDAAMFKDVFTIEAGAMLMVLVAMTTQLLADIAYTFLNPRIRYK